MKKSLLFTLFFVGLLIGAEAQQAKRYILIEHFTNTICGICASKNPEFFNTISQFPDDIHHISFHPPYPYSNCELYLHNTIDNTSRAVYYEVPGTPRIIMQGVSIPPASRMITETQINEVIGQTSPLGIIVEETNGNSNRDVVVKIKSHDTPPTGNLKLYVAAVEKLIDFNSPNGESEHHNVFRDFLANGVDFSPAASGETITLNYNYNLDSEWVPAEIYIMAFVQNDDSKEVYNSGVSLGNIVSTKELVEKSARVQVFPNPASEILTVDLSELEQGEALISLRNIAGQTILQTASEDRQVQLAVEEIPSGLYLLNIQKEKDVLTKKVVIR